MSITTAQIRGARGILNWSQSDLAERTGISSTSIGSIENGQSTPRASTLQTIRKTFEDAGIEFIGLEGVRLRSGDIRTYKGQAGLLDFYEDVYRTVKNYKGDILVSNVDERLFFKYLGDFVYTHMDRMRALTHVKYKILVREDDDFTPGGDYAEYRGVPDELFSSVPFYVFADKLAIILFDTEPTVIVMEYPAIASAYRTQFADMWERAAAAAALANEKKKAKA
ncbi:MAG TPA: helix-turn-helix transcriptional regulator [Micavibrio sp.]